MKIRVGFLLVILSCFATQTLGQGIIRTLTKKKMQYEEVGFEDMIRRYFGKEIGPFNGVEGIYSVSCVIIKTSPNFFTGHENKRIVARRDNYARVAIMKDWPGSKREFIEVSLSYREATRYPIVGEFSTIVDGGGLLYKHVEPDGNTLPFSMLVDHDDLIEGEYAYMKGRKTITYKLSYLKIFPRQNEIMVDKFPN